MFEKWKIHLNKDQFQNLIVGPWPKVYHSTKFSSNPLVTVRYAADTYTYTCRHTGAIMSLQLR